METAIQVAQQPTEVYEKMQEVYTLYAAKQYQLKPLQRLKVNTLYINPLQSGFSGSVISCDEGRGDDLEPSSNTTVYIVGNDLVELRVMCCSYKYFLILIFCQPTRIM